MDPQLRSPIPPTGCTSYCEHSQFISTQDNSKADASDLPPSKELNGGDSDNDVSQFPRIVKWNIVESKHSQQPEVISGAERGNMFNTISDAHYPAGITEEFNGKQSLRRRLRQLEEYVEEGPFKKPRLAYRGEDDIRWLKREVINIKEAIERMNTEAGEDRAHIMNALALLQMDKDEDRDADSEHILFE